GDGAPMREGRGGGGGPGGRLGFHRGAQRHHDAQIVEESHHAGDDQDQRQGPEQRRGAGGDDIKLGDEAGRERNAGEREQHGDEHQRQAGAAPEQAAVVGDGVGFTIGTRERRDDAEGAEGGDEVGEEIESDGGGGKVQHGSGGLQRDEQVAHVGDRRVGEDALDVALAQGEQVADHHGGD